MFKKWMKRRDIQRQWEQMVIRLTSNAVLAQVEKKDLESLCKLLSATMWLYSENNHVNKQTLRLLHLLKRVLADKRQYDTIKIIEYILMGHTISRKYFMDQGVKERLVAHCLQMANLYRELVLKDKPSNPFAPGQTIGEKE